MGVNHKGSKVSAKFDKDSFNVGETVRAVCFVDNTNSTKNILSLDIKLKRSMKGNIGSTFNEKTFDETIIGYKFRGMDKG